MNSLWPAAPRISCLNTRTIFRTCQQAESLAGKIAQGFTRSYCKDEQVSQHGLVNRRNTIWHGLPAKSHPALSFRTYATQRSTKHVYKPKTVPSTQRQISQTIPKRQIITRYEDLPKNYKDETGLAYRDTPVSQEEAQQIFGGYVDAEEADSFLRRIHGRRVAGTLGDPSLYLGFDRGITKKGLAWLRKIVPVDEVEYAGRRAELELGEMEADLVADAERIGLYKSTPKEQYIPNSSGNKDVYGKSGLDQIRENNLKRLDAIDAAKAKREQQAQEIGAAGRSGTLEQLSNRSNVTLKRLEDPRVKYHTEKAQQALPDEPLQMPAYQRLLPSALMVIVVMLASILFVETYTPPSRGARLFPEIPPSIATISGIVVLNLAAFAVWRILPARKFMMLNMIFHPGFPRVTALFGSIFSHQGFAHLAANMFCVGLFGTWLHEEVGRAQFLAVFLSAGILGNFTSLAYWTWRGSFISSTLGASGSVCGLIACYFTLNKDGKLKLFGYFDMGSTTCITGLALLILIDVLGARRRVMTVDHWNHLGGYAAGILAGMWIRRRSRRRLADANAVGPKMGLIEPAR